MIFICTKCGECNPLHICQRCQKQCVPLEQQNNLFTTIETIADNFEKRTGLQELCYGNNPGAIGGSI